MPRREDGGGSSKGQRLLTVDIPQWIKGMQSGLRKQTLLHRWENIKARQCQYCGAHWSAIVRLGRRTHCPDPVCELKHRKAQKRQERQRAGNCHRSRARKYGALFVPVNPKSIFERDRWICQLCRAKTKPSARGTGDDLAPELDHIVPLSQGGAHVSSNLQCACRRCNGQKGARPLGQLLLQL